MLNEFNIISIKNSELKRDLFIVFCVLIIPFLFYLYVIIPEEVLEFKILNFEIKSGCFDDVAYYVWLLFVKLFTLIILSIWFVTCQHKWKYILLVPVYFELFKISSILDYYERGTWINVSFFKTFIVLIWYSIFLIFLSIKLKFIVLKKSFNNRINGEINKQLEAISGFQKINYRNIYNDFKELKLKKSKMDKKEYLIGLIHLRDKLML